MLHKVQPWIGLKKDDTNIFESIIKLFPDFSKMCIFLIISLIFPNARQYVLLLMSTIQFLLL